MAQNPPKHGFEPTSTDAAVLAALGARLARARLQGNLTQEELAAEAGVSRSTVRRLEAGASTQLTNLIRVLRTLGLLPNLDVLVPEAPVRPIEALERGGKERRRASSPRRRRRDRPGPPSTPTEGPWAWGDEK